MNSRPIILACLATAPLWAQSAPALAVDATASRHPISPLIYGINEWPSYNDTTHVWSDSGMSEAMRVGVRRWGGDNATSYNWKLDIKNNDSDWYFTTYVVGDGVNSTFNLFHEQNLQTGTLSLGTVPVLDWTPKLISGQPLLFNAPMSCSFAVAKYGVQTATDPYDPACGNGVLAATNQNIRNDPNDVYEPITPDFAGQWVQSIVSKYGPANLGGVQMWSLDNEPEWWDGVHMDMYHQSATYDDMLKRDIATAQAVKAADPTALITGPVPGGWSGMLFSKTDMDNGWDKSPYCYWDNPIDQNAHGGLPWVVYFLQQMQQFEQQNGYRLLDYLDVHGYITPPGVGFDNTTTAANTALRLTSTRAFWDSTYIVPGFTNCSGYSDAQGNQVAPALVPTMHGWVDTNYPNTKLAITEYNWGALEDITGAVAQADILGIFGRERLDMATMWPDGSFSLGVPGSYAFQIFLNYDGNGNQFGETSVSATTGNADVLSIFAAQRHDSALTVLVLNKTASPLTDSITLKDFTPAGTAQVWQYSASNLNAIVRQADTGVSGNSISATFAKYSMTLFVIPQSQDDMIAPQPVVAAVTSAASYDTSAISPGEIVAIWGQDLGPATAANLQYNANGLLTTSLGGTQVFINGFPSPLTYAANGQVNAIVPYEVAQAQTANVVLVYQGNASAPFQIPITPVKPGIFTSGQGQGAILNWDFSVNSASNPAPRKQYVMIYGTGEGVTTPPGMDGRLSDASGAPLPTVPLTVTCTATIGGQPATVNYCGEAPYLTAGAMQVNALVPDSIAPGSAVPVTITIGGVTSQPGVTLAVK